MSIVKICLHCGNKTQMELINEYEHEEFDYDFDPDHGPIQIGKYFRRYKFLKCPVCSEFTLECEYSDTYNRDRYGSAEIQTKVLYPAIETSIKQLPSGVKEAFQAARKVRNIDGAICALAIRRTLEKMCKDQGASGKFLHNKLEDLSTKGVIPPILDNPSKIIKDIGNAAAHADEAEFDEHLIDSLLRFTEIILEYVYVLPEELKRLQTNIKD